MEGAFPGRRRKLHKVRKRRFTTSRHSGEDRLQGRLRERERRLLVPKMFRQLNRIYKLRILLGLDAPHLLQNQTIDLIQMMRDLLQYKQVLIDLDIQ